MPNLTPFEITLLVLGAVLVAALGVILWWRFAGDMVKALIAGWMALPLFWKIILPVVFGAFVLHGTVKRDDNVANVKVLPIANANSQLETGTGNWQHSHNGNIQQEDSALQLQLKTTTSQIVERVEIEDWHRHGAWKYHDKKIKFEHGFLFPFGTNHLSSAVVVSQGRVRSSYFDTEGIVSLGAKVAMFPGESHFAYEYKSSPLPGRDSYSFIWENVFVDRMRANPMNARIELFRNGDISITTNGVQRTLPRELPFAHDGFGQDAEWVSANFTNATEILSCGYSEWVDGQVGAGLTNGLYKLTVTVPEIPLETTQLKVGDYSVAVTNAGEYVFLLEKGVEYPLSVFPETATNFVYSAVDDIAAAWNMRSGNAAEQDEYGVWSECNNEWVIVPPGRETSHVGLIMYNPKIRVEPKNWRPSWADSIRTFIAVVADIPLHRKVAYQWSYSGEDVSISGDKEKSATVSCKFPYESSRVMHLFMHVTFEDKKTVALTYKVPVHGNYSGDYEYATESEEEWAILSDNVSLSASKKVVFFEEGVLDTAYSDIECRYCAKEGGRVVLDVSDDDRVRIYDYYGNAVTNGYSWTVARGASGCRYFRVAGFRESRTNEGSLVSMTYQPSSGNEISDSENVVFAQITLATAQNVEPRNRKDLGVRESVNIYVTPRGLGERVECTSDDGKVNYSSNGTWSSWKYVAPARAEEDEIVFLLSGDCYGVKYKIHEPTGHVILNVNEVNVGDTGTSGEYTLKFTYKVAPTNVSFSAVEVAEIGMVSTNVVGYFANPIFADDWDHSKCGANNWNNAGGIMEDQAGYQKALLPPWGDGGSFSWPIPCCWRISAEPNVTNIYCTMSQDMSIDQNGTYTVSKFGYRGICPTNRVSQLIKE